VRHPLDQVRLEAPIPRPHRNIFCVGKNYSSMPMNSRAAGSIERAIRAVPDAPIVFSKVPESVTGPGDRS
jgi:2-keto-4-pentenoate hydratase/2-oxohepta-3-ene-1,7-dioic acid hydratase in catechol pathway